MEERVQTSFIPKASLAVERKQTKPGGQVALANIIAGVLLILAILGAGGMFAFKQFTEGAIKTKQDSLVRSRGAFQPATIKELSRLSKRIESGKTLLGSHIALSKLFDELEALTLTTVRFSDFAFDITPTQVTMTAKGEAASFNSVALQSGGFSKSSIITDPIFSDVNINRTGNIDFNFNAIIGQDYIGYGAPAPAQAPDASGTVPENSGLDAGPADSGATQNPPQ